MSDPAALFRTITAADWRESIARSRREPNAVRERIRQALRKIPKPHETNLPALLR